MEKRYKKRIAFIISDQHFIPHGGIGSFCKSFFEMAERLNWRVDIILDKPPRNSQLLEYFKKEEVSLFYSDSQQSYSIHNNIFLFSDGVNIEKILNFRNSLMQAFSNNVYDLIITNTLEACLAGYFLGFSDLIPFVYYTHNENAVFLNMPETKVFNKNYNELSRRMMTLSNVISGTQSIRNKNAIKENYPSSNVVVLPIPIAERELLNTYNGEKEGIIFIGRYEERKDPDFFIKVIKETKLPAKILTNKKSVNKFKQKFKKFNIINYEIKAGIIGKEKVNFIKSEKLAFNPSKQESYCLAAFETLHSCKTLALKENEWWENFKGLINVTTRKTAINDILQLYNEPFDSNILLKKMKEKDSRTDDIWQKFLNSYNILNMKKSNSNTTLIRELKLFKILSIHDYFYKNLKRQKIAIFDIKSILSKRNEVYFYYTKNNTYMSLINDFSELKVNDMQSNKLFEI